MFVTFMALALYAMLIIVIWQICKAHNATSECHNQLRIVEANVPASATEVSSRSQICSCCCDTFPVCHTSAVLLALVFCTAEAMHMLARAQ